jgi:hypothetical protein
MRHFSRLVAGIVILTMASTSIAVPVAQAGMVGTGRVSQSGEVQDLRDQLDSALQREDVRTQLRSLGVDPVQAQARVDGLTDEEVQALADKMGQMPAGGDAVGALVGALLFVFIVLLVTDILGLTHVFPFVRHPK